MERYGNNGAFTVLARNRAKSLRAHRMDGTTASTQPTKRIRGEQQLATEALIRGRKMVEELAESVNLVMDNENVPFARRVEKFRGLLGEVVDFKPMARFVLSDYYDRATPKKWEDFTRPIKNCFSLAMTLPLVRDGQGNTKSRKFAPMAKDTLVSISLTQIDKPPLRVAFRVRIRPKSFFGYKVIDALTSGISLLITQRADFRPALRSGEIQSLIATLESKFGKAVKPVEIPRVVFNAPST